MKQFCLDYCYKKLYALQTIYESAVLPLANIVGENVWTDRDLTQEGEKITAIAVKMGGGGLIAEIRAR